jgi:hypothetical protein
MPNWCRNHLDINGIGTQAFLKACGGKPAIYAEDINLDESLVLQKKKEYAEFTLNALHPVPQDILDIGYSNSLATNDDRLDGHTWQIENWGTKWDIKPDDIYAEEDDSGYINFDSAWSPPVEWLKHIAPLYPDLEFSLEYVEEGAVYAGRITLQGGVVVKEEDYDGSRDPEGYKKFVAEELEYGYDYFIDDEEEEVE